MEHYAELIGLFGADEQRLNSLIETASQDEDLTDDEDCTIYALALSVLQKA